MAFFFIENLGPKMLKPRSRPPYVKIIINKEPQYYLSKPYV